jgi:hypothetical protein
MMGIWFHGDFGFLFCDTRIVTHGSDGISAFVNRNVECGRQELKCPV